MTAKRIMMSGIVCLTVSCGGGSAGGGSVTTPSSTADPTAAPSPAPTPTPTPTSTPTPSPAPTPTPAPTPFTATAQPVPAEGTELGGTVIFEVRGSGMENVELLPASGYVPRLGTFSVSQDKTYARLDFDTRSVPNGLMSLRISAFNAPQGSTGASEIIAMPTHTWMLRNQPPPVGSAEGRAARCQMMNMPYTDIGDPQPVVCIRWQLPATPVPPEQCTTGFDTPYANPEDGLPVLRDGSFISKLYCVPGANNGTVNPGCFCVP